MMESSTRVKTTEAELRRFSLVVGFAFGVIFGLLLPWLWSGRYPVWPWLVAGTLVAAGLWRPVWLGPAYRIWMRLAMALNWLNTRILLALVFYGIMTPLGLTLRLLDKDPLTRRFGRDALSYRVTPTSRPDHSHFEKPF